MAQRLCPASRKNLEPVLKIGGVLRPGILGAGKAEQCGQPRSGLSALRQRRPRPKDPPPTGLVNLTLLGRLAFQSEIHEVRSFCGALPVG